MQITTSFFTLLVASSVPLAALAAPVPNPSPSPQAQQPQQLSVDNLIQQAKGDPMVIVQQFKPIADQIASTIQEMITLEDVHKETGAHKAHDATHAHANDAHAHADSKATPTAEKHDAAAVADTNAAPTDSPADPAAAAADPAAAAGGVQKRSEDPTQAAAPAPTEDATHAAAHPEAHAAAHADGAHPRTHPEAHSKDHKHEDKAHHDKAHKEHKDKKDKKHKAKAAKAPVGRKVHTENVKKLRDLMAKANMMQEAIERVVLNNDQSIEKMPSDKDPKGVTWGLANAPVLAFSNMFNFSKQL